MREIPQQVIDAVIRQNNERKAWQNNDSLEQVESMIAEETAELDEAIALNMPAFCVASEIGDILYLGLRYQSHTSDMPEHVKARIEYAHYICEQTGIDPVDAIVMKLVRNDIKYPAYVQNNGYTYPEAKAISKGMYHMLGGDYKFSDIWLELGESMVSEYHEGGCQEALEFAVSIDLADQTC